MIRSSAKEARQAALMAVLLAGLLLVVGVVLFACGWRAARGARGPAGAGKKAESGLASFRYGVMPVLTSRGCNAAQCHGSSAGKGGFRLSLFGAEPERDYYEITRAAKGRRINPIEPRKSLLPAKAANTVPHQGGQNIKPRSPEYRLIESWLSQGAPLDRPGEPSVASIEVEPKHSVLKKGGTQRLSAAAVFSDGSWRDVTRQARYHSTDETVAAVDQMGKVQALRPGEAFIIVSCLRRSAVARVTVPRKLPAGFPGFPPRNKVDELVVAKLRELGVPPSDLCTDEEFLRRVFLDVIGLLPTSREARAFLEDKSPEKRSKLIDELLERDEFADFWALKWGDLLRIKSEFPSNLWPNAVQAYYRWVRESIAKNKPYDQFVRELLVSSGSNFRSPPVNFYRALRNRDPQGYAESAALVFMGARIGCARCHGHPQESWNLDDSLGLAAFFPNIRYKATLEWKEEIVYLSEENILRDPATGRPVPPKFLDGETVETALGEDPRAQFADWLTSPENPWFARNIANRIWFWLLGRGIIHEPDDIRPTNPPSNPALLAYLEQELIAHDYDLKHVYRLILHSRAYQFSSRTNEWNRDDKSHFSHYAAKRLEAEQLLDAVGQVTDTFEKFSSQIPEPYSFWPDGFRATQLTDGSVSAPFLELFGRPPRDTAYESDRCGEGSMRQALHMVSSSHINDRISRSPAVERVLKAGKSDEEIIEEFYLAALSRFPREEEKRKMLEYLKGKSNRKQAVEDLVWALLNSGEFLFNH